MNRLLQYIIYTVAVVLCCSCARRDLVDEPDNNNVELIIDIDLEVINEVSLSNPQTLAAVFCHPETGAFAEQEFTGPRGGKINISPGLYNLLVYNFDTYSTRVREDHHMHTIEAYTSELQGAERTSFETTRRAIKQASRASDDYLNQPVIYEPDHLFVSRIDGVDIPRVTQGSYKKVINVKASTIVEVYSLQILNVKGIENISQASIYLTGQVGSVQFGTNTITGEPSTIYFEAKKAGDNEMRSSFRTFGKYPGVDSKVYMIVDIVDINGKRRIWEWDVTKQFEDDNKNIVIDDAIDIPSTPESGEGGGFEPVVMEWDSHETDIAI